MSINTKPVRGIDIIRTALALGMFPYPETKAEHKNVCFKVHRLVLKAMQKGDISRVGTGRYALRRIH
jgi:hypothetical protein